MRWYADLEALGRKNLPHPTRASPDFAIGAQAPEHERGQEGHLLNRTRIYISTHSRQCQAKTPLPSPCLDT